VTTTAQEIRENLAVFGQVRVRAFGSSMVPALLPGDLISIQRADISEIAVGEVVMYARDARIFVHRVVDRKCGTNGTFLVTRGDRLGYDDSPVCSVELLGRASALERNGRVTAIPRLTEHPILLAIFRASDRATYAYIRLVSLWTRRAEISGANADGVLHA
jgi:signal peptidase I